MNKHAYLFICLFYNNFGFRFTAKLSRKYRVSVYPLPTPASPAINISPLKWDICQSR